MHLVTTLGLISPDAAGVTDAHGHVWIDPVPGVGPGLPTLTDEELISRELAAFRQGGGRTIVDCQPGGCGRNGPRMAELARAAGVHIMAATGFHLRKYYPPDYWLFQATPDRGRAYFLRELNDRLAEVPPGANPIQAGHIKIACEARLKDSPLGLMEVAAVVATETSSGLLVHTERGSEAERILAQLLRYGAPANRLVFCHMDKRPDAALHRELARAGVLLEYDTFLRPKYNPDQNVWPLMERMITDGFGPSLAVGTDLAHISMWRGSEGAHGPKGLITEVVARLESMGLDPDQVRRLTGSNIAERLARPRSKS